MEDITVEAQSEPIKHDVEVVISPPLTSDERSQNDISAVFSEQKNRALDVTAAANRTNFVKDLVNYLSGEDLLASKNDYGCTAFYYAAASGNLDLLKMMMEKENGEQLTNIPVFDNISPLLTPQGSPKKKGRKEKDNISPACNIWPRRGILPLRAAAMSSHREMVRHLNEKTLLDNVGDRIELIVTLIKIDLCGIVLRLIDTYPDLTAARDRNGETALHALAGKSMSSSNQQGILQRFCSLFPSTKSGSTKTQAQQGLEDLVQRIWSHVVVDDEEKISKLISCPSPLIFHAARKENIEFLRILADKRPDILWEVDERKQTIFHVAAYNGQEKIVQLLSEMCSQDDPRVFQTDKNGNTILHLAAMVQGNDVDVFESNDNSNNDGSNVIFGTAFQLQQRLRWFKKVSKIVPPVIAEARNNYSQTPRDLFEKAHGNLMKDSQKWMKDTTNSCMVAATVVATVAFAAAFVVPGGNKGDTGVPVFVEDFSFKVFAIFDALALVLSTLSVLTFLFIYSSSYSAEYFLWQLPKSSMVGLGSLLLSIAVMIVVFGATFSIIFHGRMPWMHKLVAVISSMPLVLLISKHYRFFVNGLPFLFYGKKELK